MLVFFMAEKKNNFFLLVKAFGEWGLSSFFFIAHNWKWLVMGIYKSMYTYIILYKLYWRRQQIPPPPHFNCFSSHLKSLKKRKLKSFVNLWALFCYTTFTHSSALKNVMLFICFWRFYLLAIKVFFLLFRAEVNLLVLAHVITSSLRKC